jgi:hypothetical protein
MKIVHDPKSKPADIAAAAGNCAGDTRAGDESSFADAETGRLAVFRAAFST